MERKIRKHLKKKKDVIKQQMQRKRSRRPDDSIEPLTEYADDGSSDNVNENEDEKQVFEEQRHEHVHPAPHHINIDPEHHPQNDTMLNADLFNQELPPHPLDKSTCCGRLFQSMTAHWAFSLISLGQRRAIKTSDLYALPTANSLSVTLSKWRKCINNVLSSNTTFSILRIIWDIEKSDIQFVFMLNLVRALIIVGLLYLWQFLIAFYTDPDVPISSGIILAIYMFILNLCRSVINSVITSACSSMGTRMMGMITSVMYDKGLEMDLESSKKQASLNIIGGNLEYIGWGLLYLPSSMIYAVILIIVSFLFLLVVIGNAAWCGIAFVLFIGIPCQIVVLLRISSADDSRFDTSDQRVSFMNDLYHGIKFTKLYSWEIPLMHRIAKYRETEKVSVTSYNTNLSWLRLINFAIPTVMLVVIIIYYLSMGHKLHLYIMFQLIIVAQILSGAIDMIPIHALFATEFMVALERIDEFLNIKNKTDMIPDSPANIEEYTKQNIAVKLHQANFEWTKDITEEAEDNERQNENAQHDEEVAETAGNKYGLENINMQVQRGKLIAVIGKVGSGKSSLLQAILGEMKMLSGTHYVNGTNNGHKDNVLAYVPQNTFILHGTVRDNILLGLPYHAQKYRQVIEMSALEQDLQILPQHDLTEIGEQGVTISGGQKMRVSFARALYRCYDSDIFLFDDPLSSVDIDVGQIMFKQGICKLLQNKTRIVVMNSHLFYLKYFDEIYVMNKDEATNKTAIIAKASYDELVNNYSQFSHLLPSTFDFDSDGNEHSERDDDDCFNEQKEIESDDEKDDDEGLHAPTRPHDISANSADGRKVARLGDMKQKEFETGAVPFNVYREFFWCAIRDFDYQATWFKNKKYHQQMANKTKNDRNNIIWMIVTLIILVLSQICDPVADLILVIWSTNDSDKSAEHHSPYWWITLWCIIIFVIAGLRLIAGLTISGWLSRAAFHLNMKTLYYTLRAPMIYYDTTPKSAILNRFTKDTNIIDVDIPFDIDIFTSQLLIATSYIIIVCVFIPQMIVVFILVSPAFYYLISAYRKTYIELVRLCIFGLDPITSIFSETLIGLSSIRAYKLETYFKDLINSRVTTFINLWYNRNCIYSWFDCYLDILIDFIVIAATILGFYARDTFTSPALVAFAIVYLNIISGHLQIAMLQLVWLESEFGAVQRLLWYHPSQNNIVYEANPINPEYRLKQQLALQRKEKQKWPYHGGIHISNLKLKYRKQFNYVLDISSISIKPGEKIGVCGRTGAGKSSMMVALFRLVEPELGSSIQIDGVECTKLGLHSLRKNLTIIPQDPILFMGTLRFNLDPFGEYSDEEIWSVLNKCELSNVIKIRKGQLNCVVFENGGNFSQGQKQLICIARALLKNTKCLLLDEATSSIDKHTDFLIQSLIRRHFKETTVLCIAHRLETICDYDRILVLKRGKIIEFDKPENLMKNKNGLFSQMINTVKSHHK